MTFIFNGITADDQGGLIGRRQFRIQNSKSEKSRKKFIGGPAGWKNPGPPPQILSTFRFRETGPLTACFGALFAIIPIVNYLKPWGFQGKKMVKWLPVRFYTAAGTIDHFLG
ncbi:MAG: hypothetical protein LBI94_04695 [Treponema sp.]|jgi:hypothetical protein|nr:hypothetical protein [Treponema sp.]